MRPFGWALAFQLLTTSVVTGADEVKPAVETVQIVAPAVTGGNASGQLSITVAGPESINVGEIARYRINVVNTSPNYLETVELEAALPDHLRFESAEPPGYGPMSGKLRWVIRGLPPAGHSHVVVSGTPLKPLPVRLQASARVSVKSQTTTRVTEPRLAISVGGPSHGLLGDCIEAIVTITNTGTGRLQNGGLELHPSSGLAVLSQAAPQKPYDLAPGHSLNVTVKLKSIAVGEQRLGAVAEADGGLRDEGEYLLTVKRPQLIVSLKGPKSKFVGRNCRYDLAVESAGDGEARDTVAFLELPEAMEFVSAHGDGVYDPEQHLVYWLLGTLQPGRHVELSAAVCPTTPGEVEVRGSAKDCLGNSGEAFVETVLQGHASLHLEMKPDHDLLRTGDSVSYHFTLQNRGTAPAENLRLQVTLDGGLTVNAQQSPEWTKKGSAWQAPVDSELQPGASATAVLHLSAGQPGAPKIEARLQSPDLPGDVLRSEAVRIVADE